MTNRNRIEQKMECFKDHVLKEIFHIKKTAKNGINFRLFEFRNENGSGIHHQRWIIDRGTLIVTGDCYDAIYTWNHKGISLQFLANCGLGYFVEKCRADKDGQSQKIYDAEDATETMKDIAFDGVFYSYLQDEIEPEIPDEQWRELTLARKEEICKPYIIDRLKQDNSFFHEYDYERIFHHEFESDAVSCMMKEEHEFMFGSDAWEHELKRFTITPVMHLAALKVAYEKFPEAF